jgi:hypothetical protein
MKDENRLNKLKQERKSVRETGFPTDAIKDLEAAGTGTGRLHTRSSAAELR